MPNQPPESFKSACDRAFTLGAYAHDSSWGDMWPILYNEQPAGKLFRSRVYGPDKPWSATIRELHWKYASDAPMLSGIGFDVAAFATPEEALKAWGRSADQILDWHEGKPVVTGYGHGPHQRKLR